MKGTTSTFRKLITTISFQIYVNIIGLPVYYEIKKYVTEQSSKIGKQSKLEIKTKIIHE